MNQAPREVIAASLAFLIFWVGLVLVVLVGARGSTRLSRFRQQMLAQWKPALAIALITWVSIAVVGRGLLNLMVLTVFCQAWLGLAGCTAASPSPAVTPTAVSSAASAPTTLPSVAASTAPPATPSATTPFPPGTTLQPYKVTEFPIASGDVSLMNPSISGSWVAWQAKDRPGLFVHNLATGKDMTITSNQSAQAWALNDDLLVTIEATSEGQKGIFGYRLPNLERSTLVPLQADRTTQWSELHLSGSRIVWVEAMLSSGGGKLPTSTIRTGDLSTGTISILATLADAWPFNLALNGRWLVWFDRRENPAELRWNLYAYDFATGSEFRITTDPIVEANRPAISGNTVYWWSPGKGTRSVPPAGSALHLVAFDLLSKQQQVLTGIPPSYGVNGLHVDNGILVWRALGEMDEDIFGYDLAAQRSFIITRALGAQLSPRISGNVVVWEDGRHSRTEIYGARLEATPAPPPITGGPAAADAKIEIVWPENGQPGTQADFASITVWGLQTGTLKPVPCQWNPHMQIWAALDDEPARLIATAPRFPYTLNTSGTAPGIPSWNFIHVDVSAARNPGNRIYFFATFDGVPSRTNVWAHAADARTNQPHPDMPAGIATVSDAVDAKIEIVFPHDNAPVTQTTQVNITAMLFKPGTLFSVPTDFQAPVHLWRSLNQEIGQDLGIGHRRIVSSGPITYPVWDWNDIDVSAARDTHNTYFFRLTVEGIQAFSNVWAHGVDARTNFPQMDTPQGRCEDEPAP